METMSRALMVMPDDESGEQKIFLEKARGVTSQVINPYLQKDWETEGQDEESNKQAFLARKLPVYRDALTRGSIVVDKKLKDGPLIIEADGIIREYIIGKNGLLWKLRISEKDPFKRLEIRKTMEKEGIELEGTTEIWNDPLVVSRILEEGIKEQDELFLSLEAVGKSASDAMRGKNHYLTALFVVDAKSGQTDASLHIPELLRMSAIYGSLPKRPDSGDKLSMEERAKINSTNKHLMEERKDEVILANPDISSLLAKAKDSAEKIESLNSLFNVPAEVKKERIIHSWIINLVTNPERIAQNELKTFASDVLWVYSQIEEIQAKSITDEDRKKNTNFLIYSLIAENKKVIDKFLQDRGVDTDVGNIYISSLLNEFFTSPPGKEEIDDPKTRYQTNSDFYYVDGFRPPTPTKSDIERGRRPTIKDIDRRIKEQGTLSEAQFYDLSKEDQLIIVGHVLTSKNLMETDKYPRLYAKLQKVLGITYDLSSGRFVFEEKKSTRGQKNNSLIKRWADMHVKNYADTQDILCGLMEKDIISKAVDIRWKKGRIEKDMYSFSGKTDTVAGRLLVGLISRDEAIAQLTKLVLETGIGYSLTMQGENYIEMLRKRVLQDQVVAKLGISRGWGYYVSARKAKGVTLAQLKAEMTTLQSYFQQNAEALMKRVQAGKDAFLTELFSAESAVPADLRKGLKAKLQVLSEEAASPDTNPKE